MQIVSSTANHAAPNAGASVKQVFAIGPTAQAIPFFLVNKQLNNMTTV